MEIIMDQLKEKIYDFEDSSSIEEIEKGLIEYFDEINSRKRGKLFYNDFRSIILVLPDRCLAKSCERYGLASHNHSAINLIRYVEGDNLLYKEEDEKNPYSSLHERKIVREKCVRIRISASSDTLLTDIEFPIKNTEFQLKIIRLVISLIKGLKEKKSFSTFSINLWDYNGRHLYSSQTDDEDKVLSDNYYERIIEISKQSKK